MRGAHRGVWCSKSTPLIEAELFAAESCRSAPDGRALLCAAPYAREIQGSKASKNLPDARNRAPVPRLAEHLRCDGSKEGQGSQEGTGNHVWCPVPFCPPPWARRLRRRRRQCIRHVIANTLCPGEPFSPPAASRCIGGTACRQQTVKRKKPLLRA